MNLKHIFIQIYTKKNPIFKQEIFSKMLFFLLKLIVSFTSFKYINFTIDRYNLHLYTQTKYIQAKSCDKILCRYYLNQMFYEQF